MAERAKKDLYAVLGVPRDADEKAIQKAYRRLARRHHPDVNPGDKVAEERFKQITEANAVLSDPKKRRDYDEFGEIALEAGFDAEKARSAREAFGERFGARAQGGFAGESFSFGDLDDLLGGMFQRGERGARGSASFSFPGPDLESELELDFEEAVRGTEKRLQVTRPGVDGSARSETVTVRIPPGVDSGGRIRIPGKGGEGIGGGPPGDLWAKIRVRPHAIFRREGRDLVLTLPVTVGEATLGAKVEIPTLDGRATVTVPAGTDSGARLRLRGKGVPAVRGQPAGDLHAVIQIRVPRNLDDEGRRAVEVLERFAPADLRKGLGS